MGNKKQTRITVNFRENEEEKKLYKWIQKNGVIGGDSVFIKSILYKEYLKDKEGE
ncbi:hypothetical protein HBF21_15735 [Clostridium perfringens]|uniref:hypothetical protein n=1 Tax=Clostridium perfringens TaxID=1502 RepID=UPI0013E33C83|nr:hypothetical protein [Clostridium perfringens]MBI6025090.1 hypothetical protein [Clostridium perfringens]MBI6048936.1 hypothetical protein [Clostridium perfringens]MDJ8927796.1 hypothetical protein [Clostridium perfringens]MDJ8930693.1 hypothetical protein [Clostridium perfringens]MDJ8936466.1 hypothetical protein [Clostridium perfringens]